MRDIANIMFGETLERFDFEEINAICKVISKNHILNKNSDNGNDKDADNSISRNLLGIFDIKY